MQGEMSVWVRSRGEQRQMAAFCEGKLMDYLEENKDVHSWVGAVMVGRVERVLPAVGAAFVNIGQSLNGFLPLKEMESFESSHQRKPLMSGEDVLVQVKKDAKDEKGAFLTRDIALAGLACVYMPLNRHVGVSGRVTEETERAKALALGQELTKGQAGIIVRHAALTLPTEEVESELSKLKALWQEIQEKAPYAKASSVLHREPSALTGSLRDNAARYAITVWADHEDIRAELPSEQIAFQWLTAVELDAQLQGMRLESQLQEALGRKVMLLGGGTLVMDEREALTTIDVNSAQFVGKSGMESLALSQNLAACEEIARQIRLRNLGGIVLIDFIDMQTEEEQQKVQEALQAYLKRDPAKTVIHGFTKLGLLEMTRKRTRESLSRLFTEPCPICHASGRKMRKAETKGKDKTK